MFYESPDRRAALSMNEATVMRRCQPKRPEAVDSASGIQGKTASRAGHTRESGGIVNIDPSLAAA